MPAAAPLALFGDLGLQELMLVAVVSVMIFGKRLPEVAGQAFAQFQKVRRTLSQMWRETGIDEELRRIQRDVDRDVPRHRRLAASPRKPVGRGPRAPDEPVSDEPGASGPGERRAWRPVSDPKPTPTSKTPTQEGPQASAEPEASGQATASGPGEARREP